jgi:hypothetical protein
MNIIISERQYSLLIEQSDFMMDRRGNALANAVGIRSDADYKKVNDILTQSQKLMFKDVDPHLVLAIVGIGTAFIPVVGPFISAGIGLLDAGLYYKEGDKTSAAISGVFSLLPFIGKIPGVKETSSAVWKTISSKLATGGKLVPAEIELVKQVASNAPSVQTLLNSASRKLSPLVKQIAELKPAYISRYGQDAYEKIMRDFISGASDQNYFLQTLKSGGKAAPQAANFVSKFGIKFAKEEISQIQNVVSLALDDKVIKSVTLTSKSGPRTIKIFTVPKSMVQQKLPASSGNAMFANTAGDAIYIVKDNVTSLTPKQIEDVLFHEFAHIKDPSIVKSPVYIKKYSTEALQGMQDLATAETLGKLGFQDKAQKYFNSALKKYILNPNEIIANNTMVLQSLSTNVETLVKSMDKARLMKALDGIINYTKGNVMGWSDDVARVLKYNDPIISNHFKNLSTNPEEYRKFLTKLAQQANYLKSQVKIAM